MKQITLLLICAFFLLPKAMAATEFSGHWNGMGLQQSDGMLQPMEAEFDIAMVQTDSKLTIDQCWTIPLPYPEKKTACYHSEYAIRGEQIFTKEKKVGDVFPKKISIFQGNSQVSELMAFTLNPNRDLRFRYSYSNFDGEMHTQVGEIVEAK